MTDNRFNRIQIDDLFSAYIASAGIRVSDLSIDQFRELKKAFFGGIGVMIQVQNEAFEELETEQECREFVEKIMKDVAMYFVQLNKNQN